MKNTVQNSIFRNWIRKKMNFVRLQSYFFIFQPYMSEKSSVEDSAKCFPAQIYGIFRLVPRSVKSNPYKEIIRIDISNNLETPARICYYRIGRQRYAAAANGGQGDFPYCHISDHGGSRS